MSETLSSGAILQYQSVKRLKGDSNTMYKGTLSSVKEKKFKLASIEYEFKSPDKGKKPLSRYEFLIEKKKALKVTHLIGPDTSFDLIKTKDVLFDQSMMPILAVYTNQNSLDVLTVNNGDSKQSADDGPIVIKNFVKISQKVMEDFKMELYGIIKKGNDITLERLTENHKFFLNGDNAIHYTRKDLPTLEKLVMAKIR